jgi:hypothetical protein
MLALVIRGYYVDCEFLGKVQHSLDAQRKENTACKFALHPAPDEDFVKVLAASYRVGRLFQKVMG